MRCVHLSEPEQRILSSPFARGPLLDPVSSHRKICVRVAGLPRITREADFAFHCGALGCKDTSVNERK